MSGVVDIWFSWGMKFEFFVFTIDGIFCIAYRRDKKTFAAEF